MRTTFLMPRLDLGFGSSRPVRETFGKEPPVSQGFKENSLIYSLSVYLLAAAGMQLLNAMLTRPLCIIKSTVGQFKDSSLFAGRN